MLTQDDSRYAVPTYQASPNAYWYHFLHGNVPGHEIDFIFRPDVPQGALTRQHFSHLARLIKYIEPRLGSAYAFAIGNLSRDDTQYEPGHGGIALIFGLRIKGAVDHAGRQDPPFGHAIACVDRHLEPAGLLEAAVRFHEELLPTGPNRTDGRRWYQSYVAQAEPSSPEALMSMHEYVGSFDGLPAIGPSDLELRWTIEGSTAPRRVVIVYPENTPFGALAQQMARIAGVLVASDIRWTAISTGRDQDLVGGTTVRFVPEREAVQEPDDVVMMHIRQMPAEPRDIALQLFGAQEARLSQTQAVRLKWRHLGEQPPPAHVDASLARPWAKATEDPEKPLEGEQIIECSTSLSRPHALSEAKKKRRSLVPMVILVAMLVVGLAGVGLMASRAAEKDAPVMRKPATSAAPGAIRTTMPERRTAEPIESVEREQSVGEVTLPEPVIAPSAASAVSTPAVSATTRRVSPRTTKGTAVKKGGSVLGAGLRKGAL